MAHQHFYSRVPARVSMYNKFDGFDTFAHSQGLTREFIERELTIVYADKLSKNDMSIVRKGQIKPVYYQVMLKSGKLVQSCLTFLPLDYTGERSAYFTHTLVLTDEEKRQALVDYNNTMFNKELFKTDISSFNITSPNATPINDYEELNYTSNKLKDIQGIYKKYDPELVKEFIGAILLSLCKKGKNIFFKLDVNDDQLSSFSTDFINEIISILPYNLKQNLSFITYINDYSQFQTFKLKCVSSLCPEIYQERGVFFDFKINLVTGLDLEEIRINKSTINFLYSLLENNEMRIEFLKYVNNAIDNIPSLQNLNLKTLSDLIFLFCGTCGLFVEENIIPNDESVFEFFNIYEKYRLVLNEEYRMRAYKVLKRYPNNHLGIPKTVFAKISKLYPTEIKQAKRMAMDIVLELIHTDIMREKLFTFIVNNYEEEDIDTKKTINFDLCRVFYGGFMQPQILKHFTSNFSNEPIETQDQILEKLFLTIRTTSIQQKILEFIDIHYDIFTLEQKKKFYEMYFEMLPECDELASSLTKMVNKHSIKEDEELIDYIKSNLEKKLEADYRKKESNMLPILMYENGICLNKVIELIFKDWYQRKIYNHFFELLKLKDPITKTNILLDIFKIVPKMDINVLEKLLNSVNNIYEKDYNKTTLYTWIDLYNLVTQYYNKNKNEVLKHIKDEEITNGIINRLFDVFDSKLNNQGLDIISDFVKDNKKVKESENYKFIASYINMINNIKNNEFEKAFNIYSILPNDKQLRINIANHINTVIIDRKNQTLEQTLCFDMFASLLKEDKITLDKLYTQYKDIYKRQYFTKNGANANPKKAIEEACGNALKLMFDCCYEVTKTNKQIYEVIIKTDSRLKACIQDFVSTYGSKVKKWAHAVIMHREHTEFIDYFNKLMKESKPQSGKLFKRLFLKK